MSVVAMVKEYPCITETVDIKPAKPRAYRWSAG